MMVYLWSRLLPDTELVGSLLLVFLGVVLIRVIKALGFISCKKQKSQPSGCAMPDDDEKQLRRDRLIREFYERADSAELVFAHRKAYNDLRLTLSPWAETDAADLPVAPLFSLCSCADGS